MISKFIMISKRRNLIISVSVKDQNRNEIKKKKSKLKVLKWIVTLVRGVNL